MVHASRLLAVGFGALLAATLSLPASARAHASSDWYGWQTLAVDGAGVLTGIAVATTVDVRANRLGVMAASWYGVGVVAAPAVHYAHGSWPLGIGDLALRTLVPPLTGAFGLLTACGINRDFEGSCAQPGWAIGTLIGLSSAAAFDALVLADESLRAEPPQEGGWYGWQILTIDAIGYGLGISFAASDPRTESGDEFHPAFATWVLGYGLGLLGAPIVHIAHGRVDVGLGAFGLRLLLAPVGALPGLVGYCAATSGSADCAEIGAVWGLLGGSLAVGLFDALVLARDPDEARTSDTVGLSIGPGSVTVRGYW